MTAVLNEETIHLARFLAVIEDRLQELRRETQMDETLMKLTQLFLQDGQIFQHMSQLP